MYTDQRLSTVRGLLVAFAASLLMQVVLLFAVSALGRVFGVSFGCG